ncbi:MAG: hypothetical protein U0610_09200 [bacterium]
MTVSVPAPRRTRRVAALVLAAAAAGLATSIVRGDAARPWDSFLGDDLALAVRDVAGLWLGALVAGVSAPAIAGNHVPGLPLAALGLSWVLASWLPPDAVRHGATLGALDPARESAALVELLALAVAIAITTTACWLVDTRITFPRLFPDERDRPAGKHTSRRDLVERLIPHAIEVASLIGLTAWAVGGGEAAAWRKLAVVGAAPLAAAIAQRLRPARGTIWTALGVLAGLALAAHAAGRAVLTSDAGAFLGAGKASVPWMAGLMMALAILARNAFAARPRATSSPPRST